MRAHHRRCRVWTARRGDSAAEARAVRGPGRAGAPWFHQERRCPRDSIACSVRGAGASSSVLAHARSRRFRACAGGGLLERFASTAAPDRWGMARTARSRRTSSGRRPWGVHLRAEFTTDDCGDPPPPPPPPPTPPPPPHPKTHHPHQPHPQPPPPRGIDVSSSRRYRRSSARSCSSRAALTHGLKSRSRSPTRPRGSHMIPSSSDRGPRKKK